MKTLELDNTEHLLLCVALREYLGGKRLGIASEGQLIDHPTSRAVIEGILARLDPPAGGSS